MKKIIIDKHIPIESFKTVGILGITEAQIELPKGKIVQTIFFPNQVILCIEVDIIPDANGSYENEKYETVTTEIRLVDNNVRFSLTPDFDEWYEKRLEKIKQENEISFIALKPIRDEYTFFYHDFITKKSFYLHSYKFNVFDLQNV